MNYTTATNSDSWAGWHVYYYPHYDEPKYITRYPITSGHVWVDMSSTTAKENQERKEVLRVNRQTFIKALLYEGKKVAPEDLDFIEDAKADKWDLFIARLLARVFESTDLSILKEKPKEVIVREG